MRTRGIEVALLAGLLVTLLGCSDTSTGPSGTQSGLTFPLSEGASWSYATRYLDISLPDTRDAVLDTVDVDYSLVVAKRETLLDTLACYRVVETAASEVFDGVTGVVYYGNREDGLYSFAYILAGEYIGAGVTPKKVGGAHLTFHGRPLSEIRDALSTITGLSLVPSRDDSLMFHDPPVRTLAYPLTVGKQWTISEPGEPWAIDKRVTVRTQVEVPAGVYSCYVVRWLIDVFDDDGQWDDDLQFFDYYTSQGLVKRTFTYLDVVLTDIEGQPIDTLDMWEESELTALQID